MVSASARCGRPSGALEQRGMAESQKDALVRMIKKRSSGRKPSPAAAVSQQASADAQDYYARHEVVVEAAGAHTPCLKLEAAPFPAPLLKLLQAQFETPTPIQAACWPLAAQFLF